MTAYIACVLGAVLTWVLGPQLLAVLTASLVLAGVGVLGLLTARRAMAHGVRLHHSRPAGTPNRAEAVA